MVKCLLMQQIMTTHKSFYPHYSVDLHNILHYFLHDKLSLLNGSEPAMLLLLAYSLITHTFFSSDPSMCLEGSINHQ